MKEIYKKKDMNRQEYIEYKEAIESNFGECTVLESIEDHDVKNAGNTGGRKAYNSKDWIGLNIGKL